MQLRFKVDGTNNGAIYAVVASGSPYRRFGVYAKEGSLVAQYNDGFGWREPADLLSSVQANTWYTLTLLLDDVRGFTAEVAQTTNPAVRGSYNHPMPAGLSWLFQHWVWSGYAYLDDYREFTGNGLAREPDERQEFQYDALDRLVVAQPAALMYGQGYTETYGYNAIGNLTSKAGVAYAYNDAAHKHAVTHLGGVQKFWYDANGSMTTRIENGVTYQQAWDTENRLSVVTNTVTSQVTRFTYEGDGARVKKVDSSGTTAYVGATEALITGTQRITRTYYTAGAQLVAMRVVTSTGGNALREAYLHADHPSASSGQVWAARL
ncbi:MAG TPA: hypothetical protein VFL17_11295 [Anaerolineae bacterium]|nr:hypothetical protein [Anaerolineae bacterium]